MPFIPAGGVNIFDKWRKVETFFSATEGKIKGERLEDHELVLRFAALYSWPREEDRRLDENLDEFLNEFVEKRAIGWSEQKWRELGEAFNRSMKSASRVFGRIAFRKYSPATQARRPINRGLFETEAVALARRTNAEIDTLEKRSDHVIDKFGEKFSTDKHFSNALLYATGKGGASNKRLEVVNKIFDEVLDA